MKALFKRGWHSPTLNTWASFAARSLTLVIILPILLRRFSPEELTVWYLFSTLMAMQMLAELGFGSTFVRVIAYAMGGASDLGEAAAGRGGGAGTPNFALLEKIIGTMRVIYRRLTLLLAVALGILGTWALWKPISALGDVNEGWISWWIVLVITLLSFGANLYSAWLQGANQIALLRRWEALTALGGILSSFIVLELGGKLLALVIATQVWVLISVWRNVWLSRKILDGWFKTVRSRAFCPDVFGTVWPSAWRAGVGVAMSQGVVQCSGLIYAQAGEAKSVASYLLALRLQQMITQMSNAPFYSKLPLLARWWAEGRQKEMVVAARRSMALTLWAFVLPIIGLAYFGPLLLETLGSQTPFPASDVWWLLGLAGFAERYGAMHLQLYSTTNHILWHVANGIGGTIFIVAAFLLFPILGVIALPLGWLLGNTIFYAPYSASLSHRTFGLSVKEFELRTMFLPLLVLLICYFVTFHCSIG